MTTGNFSHDVQAWVSPSRFAAYLRSAGGDADKAVLLYQWNVAAAGACFEAFQYVEVIVRNAIDRELYTHFSEASRQIPWFLLPVAGKNQTRFDGSIEKVRERLRNQHPKRETRDQILAGLDFGFWTALLHSDQEQLWRDALHRAFPNSSGKRKDVVAVLETLRVFRNRLAHHDSLLAVDISFRLSQMLDVLRWIDPAAEQWLSQNERVTALHASRPLEPRDTVVVAAKDAWRLYQSTRAYICQAGRSFQPVEHLAFYADREIKPEVPGILRRLDNVDWSAAEVNRLNGTGDADHTALASIINQSRTAGWTGGRYQVFLLTAPGDLNHVTLPRAIPHNAQGKGSAYTQRQRYVARAQLERATSTGMLS